MTLDDDFISDSKDFVVCRDELSFFLEVKVLAMDAKIKIVVLY